MPRMTSPVFYRAAAAIAFMAIVGCNVDSLDARHGGAGPKPAVHEDGAGIDLVDGRQVITYTVDQPPWAASPLSVDPITVNQWSLTSPAILQATTEPTSISLLRSAYFGEAVQYSVLATMAARIATRLGYTSVCAMVDDMQTLSRVPLMALAPGVTIDDCLLKSIEQNPFLVTGTSTDGNNTTIVAPTCAGCHMQLSVKSGLGTGNTGVQGTGAQMVLDVFTGQDPTRTNYSTYGAAGQTSFIDVNDFYNAIKAEVASGYRGSDSNAVRAWYTLANEALLRSSSSQCSGPWHCSINDAVALQNGGSPLRAIDMGYLGAFSIAALAVNTGRTRLDTSSWTDAQIDQATETRGFSDFWVGGSRANVTQVLAGSSPLNAQRRPMRHPDYGGMPWAGNDASSNRFALNYVSGTNWGGSGPGVENNYLMGATYWRLPAFDGNSLSAASLTAGGFSTMADFINAVPRFHLQNIVNPPSRTASPSWLSAYSPAWPNAAAPFNQVALGTDSYFSLLNNLPKSLVSGIAPAAACTWAQSDLDAAVSMYNASCALCHYSVAKNYCATPGSSYAIHYYTGPGQFLANEGSVTALGSVPPTSPLSIVNGSQTAQSLINAIISANGSNAVPLILAREYAGRDGTMAALSPSNIQTSTSARLGPLGYARQPYAGGNASALAFIQNSGAQAAAGTYIIPANRACMDANFFGPTALQPVASGTNRETLRNMYGITPEATGETYHPAVPNLPTDPASQALLASFLEGPMADRAMYVVDNTGEAQYAEGYTVITSYGSCPIPNFN